MIIKPISYKVTFLLVAILFLLTKANAQYASQEELKKAAQTFFDTENYIDALPLYSQLLSLYPKDPDYNYKYGASYFYGSREKENALKYLRFAVTKPNVNPQAFYFLAMALHHEYLFAEAELNYNRFKEKGVAKDVVRFEVDRKIEMCKNGVTLIKSMTDIGVLVKKEIKATDFFRSYDLRGIGGKIIVKPDEFKTKLDIKNKEYSIIHIGDNPTMVVFSSFGNDGKNGKDIYKVVKLPNGEWSKPTPFPKINTNFDEDYPFLHPDGKTLYFSSKGYNSMGGYDIFKSTLNPETGEWGFPENLDFPINTPDDDILFISDIDNQLAYFASSRSSKQGELTVYKVKVETQPAKNTIVKGVFIAESNPNLKSATITIADAEKDRKYGVFTTNNTTGDYLLVFPGNGGKFKILVETTNDAPVHSAIIELPALDGFRALKQELRLVGQGSSEKLVVKNLFNESDEFDVSDPLIVENLLKYKAKMDVNLSENELNTKIDDTQPAGVPTLTNLSNQQLVDNAKKSSSELANNAKLSKAQANQAYNLATQKSEEAKTVYNQYQQKVSLAKESQDLNVKTSAFIEAEQLKLKAATLVNEAVASLDVAKTLESEAVERESDVKKSAELSTSIASKINADNRSEAETNYAKLDEIINSTYNATSALATEKEILDKKLSEKEFEYNKARNTSIELTNRETELEEQIDVLKDKINKTSKKQEKEALQAEVNALTIDFEDVKYDLGVAEEKEIKVGKELNEVKNKNAISTNIIAEVSKTTVQTPTKTTDKTALNNDILFFEKQGLVGLYPSEEKLVTTNTTEKFDLKEHQNEYSIISDEGKIIDYSSKHSSELVDAQNNTNEYQKSLEMAKINQDWIADMNEEIAIKEKQLQVADNLNDKTKITSRIEVLKNLKDEKQKEVEQQLLSSSQLADNNSQNPKSQISNPESQIPSTNITDAQGNIIDYSSNYEKQLAVLDEKESTPLTIKEKITVYEQWKNANEQELLLKKIDLKNAEGEDKINIVNRIEDLDNQISSNKEYIALYTEKLSTEEQPLTVDNSQSTINSSQPTVNNSQTSNNSKSIDYSKYDSKVVNTNGEVLDYATDYNNQLAKADNMVNPLNASKEKEKIVAAWIESVNEEINLKNDELAIVDEDEKGLILEKISSLNTEKTALAEQLSDIQTVVAQQELVVATNTTNNTTATEPKNATNNNSGEFQYSSKQAQTELAQENNLKENIIELTKQIDELTTLAYASKNETEKEQLFNEVSNLKGEQEAKQLELAKVYEKTNKAEYYNNQEAISKVKQNANTENDNAILAELNTDEANTYFEKAQEERTKAVNSSIYSSQASSLEKAEKLEKTAIEKQRKAIELYGSSQLVVNSSQSTNLQSPISNSQSSISNSQSPISNSQSQTSNIYQPTYISMPSEVEKDKAKSAEKEADRLEKMALVLQDDAQKSTDNAEKEELTVKSNAAKEKAVQLRKDAEISYANANELTAEEKGTVDEINNNRIAISNEKFTEQDQTQINNLSSSEINEIKNSTDYVAYVQEKQASRRLVKEAEVDYIEADKLKEEADDQKTLGISLNAMASGAQGDDKTKLLGQIEKLNVMILDNETKAAEHRTTATNKELTALEKTKNAASIIASTDKANAIKAIEKAETFNTNFLTDAIANNTTNNEPIVNNNEPLTTNNEPLTTNNEPLTTNNEQITNNNEPITNNNEQITTNNEPLTNNNEQITNNNEQITNNKPQTTTNLANADEIPQVLTDQIFVFTPNKSAAYSENKRIPSAVKLPEGLVFKVQIGAFRNPIPQDHFRGFAPIMAEDAGGGITRYTAGLFKTFNMANEAKNAIKTIGYPDAFVVAFYNGKRININEARAMVGGIVASNQQSSISNPQSPISNPKSIPTPKTNVELVEDGISTDVNKIQGVFFTVQVGVYSKPITAEQLNNVTPLNSERTANGLIRYTSGIYPNLSEANAAKERIRTLGITDAFVIAYANGNRVEVNDAVNFVTENKDVAVKSPITNPKSQTSNQQPQTNNTAENTSMETPSSPEKKPINQVEIGKKLNIEFKVLLGEYTEEIPVEDAQIFLKLSKRGDVKIEDTDGKTVYTIGSYPDYPSALDLQVDMKVEGVKSPKVIAFKDGSQVEVAEALELVKNQNNQTK